MEWVASTLHTTSEHGVSSITTADAHNSAASSRLNWRPRRFKWTRLFRRKTKSGFCACAITFQRQSTLWMQMTHRLPTGQPRRVPWGFRQRNFSKLLLYRKIRESCYYGNTWCVPTSNTLALDHLNIAHSESKYSFAVKKSSKVSYKILLLSDSTFFKLFFHIFAAIIEARIVAGHKFLYTLLIECGRLRC